MPKKKAAGTAEGIDIGSAMAAQPERLKGEYSNLAFFSHTEREFILDFFLQVPGYTVLASRIITSPGHAKAMLKALSENLEKYERKFGHVEPKKQPKKRKKRR